MGFDKFDTQFDKNFRLDDLFMPRFKFWFFKQSNLQLKNPAHKAGFSDVSLINGKGLLLISAWNIGSEEKILKSILQEEGTHMENPLYCLSCRTKRPHSPIWLELQGLFPFSWLGPISPLLISRSFLAHTYKLNSTYVIAAFNIQYEIDVNKNLNLLKIFLIPAFPALGIFSHLLKQHAPP